MDANLQKQITKYFSCYLYPTNKLYDMVEHDFLDLEGQEKHEEELKQKKLEFKQMKLEKTQNRQFKITTVIAIASLFSSAAAIIVPIINEKNIVMRNKKLNYLFPMRITPSCLLAYKMKINFLLILIMLSM